MIGIGISLYEQYPLDLFVIGAGVFIFGIKLKKLLNATEG